MARRIRATEVLRLRSVNGLSQNAIARTAHVSKHSVQDVLEAARERGVSREDVEGMSEEVAALRLHHAEGPQPDEGRRPQVPRGRRPLGRLLRGPRPRQGGGHRARHLRVRRARRERGAPGTHRHGQDLPRMRAREGRLRQEGEVVLRPPARPRGPLAGEPGAGGRGERKLVRKYGSFGPLVVDEWLLDRPDTEFRSMLLELMELRYGTASTAFCTQFKKKD